MDKNSLKEIYTKAQKPVAYSLLIIAIVVPYTPYTHLLVPALSALALLILTMLFTIEDKVSDDFKPKEFSDFYHSTQAMQKALEEASNTNSLRVKWIGTSMDSGWAFIRKNIARILEQRGSATIDLEVYMLAEDFNGLANLNKLWPTQVRNNCEDILNWKNVIEETYPDRINVKLVNYRCVPYYSGMLVNESTLFLAFCSWGATSYNVGTNPYIRYSKSKGQGFEQISQFIKWSEFYKNISL